MNHPAMTPLVGAAGVDRRSFIKTLGGGLAVLWLVRIADAADAESGESGRATGSREVSTIAAWLHLAEDNTVTVFTGKTEVGQNIRTSLAQAVAEELFVPVASIHLVMADTDLVPFDQGTFGSRTTPQMNLRLRRVAATAREALLDLAAEHFKVDRAGLVAADGRVSVQGLTPSVAYGELTRGREITRTVDEKIALRPAAAWTMMGTSVRKIAGREFVTGRHRYTTDLRRPDMAYGRVLRPSAFGATLARADTREAEAMPGTKVVRDGDFIGVVAPDSQRAARAIAAIRGEWKTSPQISSPELWAHLKRTGEPGSGRDAHAAGSVADGLAASAHKFEHTYTVAYIAHVPLEPRGAVAEWKDDRVTVWTGTQRPFGVRADVARALGLGEDRVRVLVPDTGSGYGGKHTGEAAIEAARLARAAGRPVKVTWTREEEFTWAYARPAGVIEVTSGCRADGTLTAWEFHNYNSGGSGIALPYDCPNQRIEFHRSDSPLRQGSYRGLAATANHFARESHLDDMARALALDPLAFRMKNLSHPRLRAVLEAAAEKFGWGQVPAAADRGFGLAVGTEKGSYMASCAELAIDREHGEVRVVRIVSAYECGAVVNPAHLLNQTEGAILQGLGGALFEALDFADGRILNPRFSQYRVPRFRDLPLLETVILDRKDLPSAGAGETPIITVAPAIRNAIAAATGILLRALPLVPHGLEPRPAAG